MAKLNLDEYVTVAERIDAFFKKFPHGSIQSQIVHDDGKRVVLRAEVFRDPEDPRPSVGHAEEIRGDGPVNRTSALENAETSAAGRAIAMLGFEVKKGVASREEVEQAIAEEQRQQSNGKATKRAAKLRDRIRELDVIDAAHMKLTSYGHERLEDLDEPQALAFDAWLDKVAADG